MAVLDSSNSSPYSKSTLGARIKSVPDKWKN